LIAVEVEVLISYITLAFINVPIPGSTRTHPTVLSDRLHHRKSITQSQAKVSIFV
jgi:hypothetical protein